MTIEAYTASTVEPAWEKEPHDREAQAAMNLHDTINSLELSNSDRLDELRQEIRQEAEDIYND